jgi:drug/metabolite transporter (DMT)-like permease
MPNDSVKSYLHLHLIVFIWGFTAILGALISLEAMSLVWYRMLFALFFIGVYMYIKKIPITISKTLFLQLIFSGFIIALHWYTFFKAIKVSNVSITLACLSTGAFFTSLLEPILYKKKIVWYEVFFGFLVFIGLYIIFQVEGNYWFGIILALISAFLSALFAVINSKFVKQLDPTVISFYELFGGVVLFSVLLFFGNSFSFSFFQLNGKDLVYLTILSSICTAYAFIASTAVMKFLSPYTVMLTINLEPVYGIILALLLFDEKEKMSFNFYIGAIIIIFTVLFNAFLKSKKKQIQNNV